MDGRMKFGILWQIAEQEKYMKQQCMVILEAGEECVKTMSVSLFPLLCLTPGQKVGVLI